MKTTSRSSRGGPRFGGSRGSSSGDRDRGGSRGRGRSAKQRTGSGRRTKCRFCRSRKKTVDYKDINSLRKLTTLHGKIYSRKRSGNCARHQRQLKVAIKRARYLSLI
jgi:small subunit ribosomal protein S18